jgi:uncharacterized delta-60 repeat protein
MTMKRSLLKNVIFNIIALFNWAIATSVVSAQVNGSVDTSFGSLNNWAVFDPVGQSHANVSGTVTDLLPLADGKILAAGHCTSVFGPGACLYRWTSSGVPDVTFGASGVALVFADASITTSSGKVRLLRRSNGALFVASRCTNVSFGVGICVAAVNANGSGFDTTFGTTGQTLLPLPSAAAAVEPSSLAIALQPDGKLLVGTICLPNSGTWFICIARLTTGAVFDSSFGVSNWSTTSSGVFERVLSKLTLLPDGRYFALAECGGNIATANVCAHLFFPNGGFQRTLTTDVPDRIDALFDGRVHGDKLSLQWATYGGSSGNRIYAARRDAYTVAGNYDTSFGGYLSTGVAGDFDLDASNDGLPQVGTILRDGSFLYVGRCNTSGSSIVFCTTRLTPNGVLDVSYGVGGRFEYGTLQRPWSSAMGFRTAAETVDGKVVVAGYCNDGTADRPCVLRINGGPDTAKNCTMDIDGDGLINATTDGLILLRAMLGISGTNALANAVAPGATRSTWPQVREYLFDQCRMPVSVQ